VQLIFLALYESTQALKWVAYNISGKENNIGMQCDIQSFPTRPHLLPHPNHARKLLKHFYLQSIPTTLAGVADLQEQLFSLVFLGSSKHQYPLQVSRLEDEQLLFTCALYCTMYKEDEVLQGILLQKGRNWMIGGSDEAHSV